MKKVLKSFWDIWTSYATYYFGKVNLSIVVPALLVAHKELSLYNVGLVSSAFFFTYALGQFLHGQISEKHNPFIYISVGLILSGIMNLLLGACGGFFMMLLLLESFDGFFQAMGWSSCVRANTLIQSEANREHSATLLGTSYQIGNSVAWLVSAFAVGAWGWEAGFWVAGIILLLRGILLLITKPQIKLPKPHKTKDCIQNTLTFPIIMSGIGLCFLNMVRYGVVTWIPLYLFQQGKLIVAEMGKVGLKVFLIPIAGVLGTLVYNEIKKVNRDVLSFIFLILLGISFLTLPLTTGLMSLLVLLIGSFFTYGPHVFLVSTLPTRFKDKKVIGASTGFIDGMGYIGTVLIGVIVPFLIVGKDGGWNNVFLFWAILSFITAGVIGITYWKSFKEKK